MATLHFLVDLVIFPSISYLFNMFIYTFLNLFYSNGSTVAKLVIVMFAQALVRQEQVGTANSARELPELLQQGARGILGNSAAAVAEQLQENSAVFSSVVVVVQVVLVVDIGEIFCILCIDEYLQLILLLLVAGIPPLENLLFGACVLYVNCYSCVIALCYFSNFIFCQKHNS